MRFKLIASLDNKDIKLDIISTQEKGLEDTVKCIESKENGKIARKKVGWIEAKTLLTHPPTHSHSALYI